ncbi:amino acid ABC transporter permease [Fructobacillus evanidus]|uniref:Permease component (HisM) n=1 Tax=Fructobacillus evanidus TaxID=3064281 RepID=A0ABN9Z0G2_9LACO|nr:ABC-type amino acid transport system [Fructobacillus sp. LMG 32999]CAK1250385.1 ABC-type amino acid transport system [Fructobacillus sp. LMG 32999]CAK1253985.1 ABC-type amino acid transport system [Fructobacillus sp. LMG 32999]CAK1254235.1 ABC-type amino acid transport system [Fructobacillus sp. LMG 32999]CAK1254393.1 ABC-type amino acid transport system [Fructobacillus sp. LMG 32999]
MLTSAINLILAGTNINRLIEGLGVTIEISVLSIFFGTILGGFLGLLWSNVTGAERGFFRTYLEIFRIVPTIPLLFLFYYTFPRDLNLNLPATTVSVLVFSLWFGAEFSDIVRAAVQSVAKGQKESAYAIGLTTWQSYRYVLLPQSLVNILPAYINLSTRIIKTTSILLLISVTEVITVGQQIIEANSSNRAVPLIVYGLIALFYFLINGTLTWLSKKIERKVVANDR